MAAEAYLNESKYVHKKCEHGKQKYFCKECGGKGYCEHGKLRHNCPECSTTNCEHGKQKYYCKECGGKGYCEHNRNKKDCTLCKGSMICSHGKRKRTCIECKGSSICLHGTRKSICIPCKGSSICMHDKIKNDCIICTPNNGCQHCRNVFIKHSRWKPYCFRCYCVLHPNIKIPRQFKLKEHYVMDALKEHYKDTLTMTFDKCIQSMHSQSHQNDVSNKSIEGGCCKHRPDLFIDFGSHCLVIEIDENQHANYICEQKRMIAIYEAIGFRKVVFIRFNPDGYSEGTQKYKSPFGYTPTGMISINKEEMMRRIARLVEQIDAVKEEPQEPLTIYYLFFTH